ncbi:FAD synthase [uncultured archaeon]|nr:FAD synthase [uncultured archaeon]
MDAKELYLLAVQDNGITEEAYRTLSSHEQGMLEKKWDKYWLKKDHRHFKVVLTGGVFDVLHIGHVLTLKKAREHGDILIAVVATDERVQKVKNRKPLHTADYRRAMVSALKMVDLAIVGGEDMMKTFERVSPDVVAFGYDQEPMKLPPHVKSVHLSEVKEDESIAKTSAIIRKLGL